MVEILSHGMKARSLEEAVARRREEIVAAGDKPYGTVADHLALLERLTTFEFGRYILLNQGLNAYWTEYLCSHPQRRARGEVAHCSPAERDFLEQHLHFVATQERYAHFHVELQKRLRDGCVFASLPCGLMCDLLLLDHKGLSDFKLIGIDLDTEALAQAKAIALTRGLAHRTEFWHMNAWNLEVDAAFDLLSSNGLNIYERDDERVTELYRRFHRALKPGGILLTSTLSPSPMEDPDSSWRVEAADAELLRLTQGVSVALGLNKSIVPRGPDKTRQQLRAAGFTRVELLLDRRGVMPAIIAEK